MITRKANIESYFQNNFISIYSFPILSMINCICYEPHTSIHGPVTSITLKPSTKTKLEPSSVSTILNPNTSTTFELRNSIIQ